jgi:PAS domain S-box-containing protein
LRQWESLLGAIPTGMAIYDCDGRLVQYNDFAAQLWGQAPLPGTVWFTGAWRVRDVTGDNPVATVLRTGQPLRDCEEAVEHRDGTCLILLQNLDPLRDCEGRPVGVIACFRDITKRAATHSEVKASEETLRAVVETTPECVKIVAADGTLLRMNEAGLRMIDADSAEMVVGSPVLNMIAPDYRDEWWCNHRRVCNGERLNWQFDVVSLRGMRRRLETAAVPLPQADGSLAQLAVTRDVTRRRVDELRLRESEERFRRIFEQSPVCKMIAGVDFRLTSVNPALCRMLGYTEGELIGHSFLDLVYPEDRAACAAAGRALRDGEIEQIQLEGRYLRKSGDPIWVSVTVGPIRDAEGRFLSGLAVIENIDDRKRMTEALQASEQRLREFTDSLERLAEERARQLASSRAQLQAFFHNSPDWLTLQRVGADGTIVYVDLNATCEAAYGLPREQVIGRHLSEILGREEAEMPSHHIRECVRSGVSQRYVARRTMAGRTRTIDVMVTPVPGKAPDGSQLIITTARDLTERDELEAQLRQAQKMEVVGQLTGGVAHDFNNLLTAILGNLELLQLRMPGDAQSAKQIDAALRAAHRGARLTEQLLAFSRRQHLRPEPVSVNLVLDGMNDLVARTIGPNIAVKTDLAAEVWPALADRTQLEIAVLNLAINARDAMPDGGTVFIGTANVAGDSAILPPEIAGCDCIEVMVRDTGTGMSAETLARAVEPFFTTKESGKGSGLGLSQVYGLAQQSGGALRLESRFGEGTTVRIYLPRSPAAAALMVENAVRAPGGRHAQGHILVVDDEDDVREIAALMLRHSGYSVTELSSGEAALDALSDGHPYDLVLIDVAMPGLGGIETLRRARVMQPGLPALLMTGYISAHGSVGGHDPLIKKPFMLADLAKAVEETLNLARDDAFIGLLRGS